LYRSGLAFLAAILMLSGCRAGGSAQPAAPSSQVVALAAAATATALAPTSTPIRLATATPGPTGTATALPAATPQASSSSAGGGSLRLATPVGDRPGLGPAARATELAPATPGASQTPAATPADAATAPLPPGPQGGPAPVPTPPPNDGESVVDERNRPLVERATRALADELGIAVEDITLVAIEQVVWPDGGLGCAAPDAIVQPVETPGYRIVLAAAGGRYEYHTDLDRQLVRCDGRRPRG